MAIVPRRKFSYIEFLFYRRMNLFKSSSESFESVGKIDISNHPFRNNYIYRLKAH